MYSSAVTIHRRIESLLELICIGKKNFDQNNEALKVKKKQYKSIRQITSLLLNKADRQIKSKT